MHIQRNKGLFVFDFDDTLCKSDSHTVYIYHSDGTMTHLPGHHWSEYTPKPGDRYDFADFENLKNPLPNTPVWNIYKSRIEKHGNHNVHICTARQVPTPLEKWLIGSMGIESPNIACMSIPPGDNNGIYKARFVSDMILKYGYGHVEFYDDRHDCVHEVFRLKKNHPTVNFVVGQVEGEEITYLR